MAQDKILPLTYNGEVIGSAKIDENGFIMAEVDVEHAGLFPQVLGLSLYSKGKTDD